MMKKKSISPLFDNKKINSGIHINGGATGSSTNTVTDTGLTTNGTYDIETTPTGGGCDKSNTGYPGTSNGELDNPGELAPRLPSLP